jgi:trimethylamine--corrinoid protein Co-methyltransferase
LGYAYKIPEYRILSPKDLDLITETSLDVLQKIGMKVPNDHIQEVAHGHGAEVDTSHDTIRFPRALIMNAVETAGKKHILYGLDRSKQAEFGYDMFNFNGSSGQYQIVEGNRRRAPTRHDLKDAIRLGEGLDHINIVGSLVVPSDVPTACADVVSFFELMTLTSKPFTAWIYSALSARIIISLMETAAGGRDKLARYPLSEAYIEPVSPLMFRPEGLDILLEFVKAGLPVGISPMVQTGATGPCSLAGTIAQENAEILGGIAIVQLLRSGHPVTYGGISHIFDVRAGTISFGSPEQALMAAALTQIGRSYGFPVYSNTALSDSKALDAQYGIEAGSTLAFGALARSDLFGHLGICGADNAASLTQLVIDDELAAYAIRLFSGFDVSHASLAYREIEQEGIGGNFLMNDLTLDNYSKELWFPGIFERSPWNIWEQSGSKNVTERAVEKRTSILSRPTLPIISDETRRELEAILKAHDVPVS